MTICTLFMSCLLALLTRDLPPMPVIASCAMHVEQVTRDERGLFVTCNERRFRVYHPKSMYGLVTIHSAADALAFVRFFSTRSTAPMAGLGAFVEVRALSDARALDFYYVKADVFAARFAEPSVTRYDAGVDGTNYRIERVVLYPDQRIFRITERVSSRGNYDLVDQVLVERDASSVGLRYSGLH